MAYTAWSVVYGEQPTAAKWNQLGTNDAGFKDGTNIDSGAIITAKLAGGAATTDKNTAVTYAGNMSSVGLTTSDQVVASQVLPTYSAPHKFLIVAQFEHTHAGASAVRDYAGRIKNGSTTLAECAVTNEATTYVRNMSTHTIFTSSGGETINFTYSRATDNGGTSIARSRYSIVDLGRA